MSSATGGFFPKTPSSAIDDGEALTWPMALLLLLLLGVGSVALPALRMPLKLPRHQGLQWMALLMLGRQRLGRRRWGDGAVTDLGIR